MTGLGISVLVRESDMGMRKQVKEGWQRPEKTFAEKGKQRHSARQAGERVAFWLHKLEEIASFPRRYIAGVFSVISPFCRIKLIKIRGTKIIATER